MALLEVMGIGVEGVVTGMRPLGLCLISTPSPWAPLSLHPRLPLDEQPSSAVPFHRNYQPRYRLKSDGAR